MNVVIIVRTITDALKRVEPSSADEFEANYEAYEKRMRDLSNRLVERMRPFRGSPVVTYHRTWPYFLNRFGLVSIGEVEPKPGISPGPRHLIECVENMQSQGAKVVLVETFNSL
ncbi:MAG: zinc ABC transporter substrate-binding protein [Planctomycetes bacterium]|nr:zinc ABC transporter substrate-binding protein [Planctomycetota bacterium]